MSIEENKETIRRFANVINSGDLSKLDDLCAEQFVYKSSAGEEYHGLEGAKDLMNSYREAFPDLEISLEEIVAEGNRVFSIYRQTGTHEGELMGIEPTNEKMDLKIAALATFENGKVVEQFDTYDSLELLKQLGVVSEEVRPGGRDWPTGETTLRPQ